MFDKNSEVLINWFENLEEKCHKLIYEKKNSWFQGNLEENDIETAFNPLIRVYKSGKFYLLRTNIKNTKDDNPSVKIYNEKEITLGLGDITSETDIISILDIQGIKFTSRNFQIEIDLKQVMVLDNEPIFESCLIKTNKNLTKSLEETKKNTKDIFHIDADVDENILEPIGINKELNTLKELENKHTDPLDTLDNLEEIEELDLLPKDEVKDNTEQENITLDIDFEDLNGDIQENTDELREIDTLDLNLDKNDSTMTLKKPNQVYFQLYKEARNKAKQAKKTAILAYLEAKNIKKTYMIENINDSDSEFDAEIDDVSESELEGL